LYRHQHRIPANAVIGPGTHYSSDADSVADRVVGRDRVTESRADGVTNPGANSHADADSDAHTNANSNSDAHAGANADADSDSSSTRSSADSNGAFVRSDWERGGAKSGGLANRLRREFHRERYVLGDRNGLDGFDGRSEHELYSHAAGRGLVLDHDHGRLGFERDDTRDRHNERSHRSITTQGRRAMIRISSMMAYKFLSVTLAATFLAGCSSGGSTSSPTTPHQGALAPATASIVLVIPAPDASTNASVRHAAYISAVSRSATLAITPGAGCGGCTPAFSQNYTLTGVGTVCTSSAPRTCTIPLLLLPGTYTASLILYDGFLTAGSPTGNPISEQTSFPIQIVSGQTNAIGVTLAGVPVTLTQTVTTPAALFLTTHLVNGTPVPIYRFNATAASAQLTLVAKDTDGSIIAGPGAPTWSANTTGTGYSSSVSGNTLTVTDPASRPVINGSLTINAVSTACTDPTARCSATFALGLAQIIAVADTGNGDVSVWPIGAAAPIADITTGISGPFSVGFSSNGTLFVANDNNSTVTYYAPPYTGAPSTITTQIHNPDALVIDAHDDVIVANQSTATVTIYPPPYTTTAPVTLNTGGLPSALTLDAAQHLWIVTTSGALYRYSPPYTAGAFDVGIGQAATGFSQPDGLAIDSTGRLYVANSGHNNVLRFDPPYSSQTPSATIGTSAGQPMTNPATVIVGAGDVMLAGSQDGLDVYSSAGAPLGLLTTKIFKPRGLAIDADSIVWVATGSGNGVTGVPPPYDGTNLMQLGFPFFINPSAVAVY
jgi:hypothetical protein